MSARGKKGGGMGCGFGMGRIVSDSHLACRHLAEDKAKLPLCTLHLDEEDIEELREAIEKLYYFEFVLDGLAVNNYIGWLREKVRACACVCCWNRDVCMVSIVC